MLETRAADARQFTTSSFDPQRASAEEWAQALAYWRQRHDEDFPGEPQPDDAHTQQDVRQHTPLHVVHRAFARDAQGRIVGSLNMGVRPCASRAKARCTTCSGVCWRTSCWVWASSGCGSPGKSSSWRWRQ